MTLAPAHHPDAAPSLAAAIGALLCTLLAALLGVAGRGAMRVRAGDLACDGLIAAGQPLLEAEWEPEVEWIAVPAPWRATQGAVRRYARVSQANAPCPRQPGAPVRAPPRSMHTPSLPSPPSSPR
ncbi:MAG: hypothetical protein NT133_21615, partial [Alphaproteobacteria bacterium]|nr:hypothetical protein [Alphaproteobacteria bacterium]